MPPPERLSAQAQAQRPTSQKWLKVAPTLTGPESRETSLVLICRASPQSPGREPLRRWLHTPRGSWNPEAGTLHPTSPQQHSLQKQPPQPSTARAVPSTQPAPRGPGLRLGAMLPRERLERQAQPETHRARAGGAWPGGAGPSCLPLGQIRGSALLSARNWGDHGPPWVPALACGHPSCPPAPPGAPLRI